ncbi:hypothetical protein EMIT036CA2_40192 [Chryseobacterium sp. IT-36CA2]
MFLESLAFHLNILNYLIFLNGLIFLRFFNSVYIFLLGNSKGANFF